METEMETEVGKEETKRLSPLAVVIKDVMIETVGEKKSKKVICYCVHPSAEANIEISQAKVDLKDKLIVSGLWYNKFKESDGVERIRKDSALGQFLIFMKCKTIQELKNKSCETILDDSGYLAFKGY